MSTFGITKTQNAASDGTVPVDQHDQPKAWCEYCSNEGICMLEGTDHHNGVEYTRGSAPCPWCLQGELRYAEWTADSGIRKGTDRQGGKHVAHHRRFEPKSDFTMYDVLATGREPRRTDRFVPTPEWLLEREAGGIPRGALKAIVSEELWPDQWRGDHAEPLIEGLGGEDAALIRRRREQALQAKNEAERQEGSP